MWINNKIFKEDMEYIIHANFINWEKLNNKTIFITGATGLIGYYLTSSLVYKNIKEKMKEVLFCSKRKQMKMLPLSKKRTYPKSSKMLKLWKILNIMFRQLWKNTTESQM